jgi:biopolymer transport protein ExbD
MADAGATNAPEPRGEALAALQAMAIALPDVHLGRRPRRGAAAARRRRRAPAIGIALRTNMTPMIDVVFQLLVFFIATTRYATDERVIPMELARREAVQAAAGTAGAAPAPKAEPTPARAAFAVNDESLRLEVRADGTVAAGAPLRRTLTPPDLRAMLAAELRGTDHPKGMFEPGFAIVVAPEDNASWEAAVEVLDAAVAAGFRNVGFERRPGIAGKAP